MNDIYSKEFQRRYQKSKYKLRQWEDRFLAENGRLPTRADIKVSPASIKDYYKVYWKLKTQILEAQILSEDVLSENHTFIRSNSEGVLKEHTNTLNAIKKNDLPVLRTANGSKENICQSQPKPIDLETWGAHLNRSKTIPNPSTEKTTFLNDVIAGRLFKGSNFKKRNPRKALSFSKKKSNKSLTSEDDGKASQELGCTSPFFDSQESSFSVDQSLNDSSFCADASIGEAFFSGNKGALFSAESNCSPNIKALITSATSLSPILNKSSMAEEKTVTTVQPVSLIQAIASDPSVALKSVRNIDSGWVERCAEVEKESERKSSLDSGFDSMELTLPESDSKEDGKDSESDDDLIGSSDNEVDHNDKLSCSFLSQKRKAEELRGTEEANSREEEKTPSPKTTKKVKVDPYEFVDEGFSKTVESIKESVLMKKMKSGTANENYVKINLKKKVYVRGKKNFSFCRYKKQEWKNKKKNLVGDKETGDAVRCFKCGDSGHFSRYCNKAAQDKLPPFDEDEGDGLPTLEEAEAIAKEESLWRRNNFSLEVAVAEDESTAKVEPLYQLNEDGSLMETPMEVLKALHKFGHSEFRPGQEATIMRILSGQSTLLTIATGGGKSLCYQLPAYLYANRCKCITLVVSPLVSLMEDQVSGSSSFFKVGCLHTNQTQKQRQVVLEDAKNGSLFALLISPEAVVSGDCSAGFGSVFKQLPPIAFACIDEVHCVSQWSHNFRPSYLMISKVLREKLGITTILGLTASATVPTIRSITSTLHIPSEEGVIRDIPIPDNLCLSVSRDENKDRALLQLLQSARFKDSDAILIYCTRRDECERLAVLIRTVLHDPNRQTQSKTKRLSWNAESYHAGMAAARRKQVQKAFMCGNLRIVVATIAFGMGINKQDIRGVIHYNMPKDFESYVQEVGRAGRDGMLAHCHLFLDSKGRDLNELRRHIHSDSVDRFVLRKLLQKVFVDCECKAKSTRCEGHEVAFDCKDTIQSLDIPEENIHTLLCYLELHEKNFAKVLAPSYVTAKIRSYKGMKALHAAARKCPPLAYACALRSKSKQGNSSCLEFNVIDVANKLSWSSGQVKSQLKNLEWEVTEQNRWKKTGIAVDFLGLGFRVFSKGDLTPSELDEALDYLIQRVENQEKRSSAQLDITFSTFDHFAEDNCASCMDDVDRPKSVELKNAIRKYFETEEISPLIALKKLEVEEFDEEALAADVRALLCTYRDNTFNGRAVARIFHGIQSPNYPASLWCKCRFWRQHLDKDFKKISRIATREILRLKI